MRFPRSFYIPKHGTTRITPKGLNAEIFAYESFNQHAQAIRYYALAFAGKAQKPSFHHSFKTPAQRAKWVTDWIDGLKASQEAKRKYRDERNNVATKLQVGSILRSSWGYDQTNIDYYEVTALIGTKTCEIRSIAKETEETGFMQGKCVPVPGNYCGEPMRKKILYGDSVKIDHHYAYLETPKEIAGAKVYQSSHWTSYA